MRGASRLKLSLLEAALALAVLALAIVAGCASPGWKPPSFAKNQSRTEAVGITTKAQRIEQLRAMQKQVKSGGAAEQQKALDDLTTRWTSETDTGVRIEIIRTASMIPGSTPLKLMQQGLDDSQPDVRIEACKAFGARKSPETLQQLGRVLTSDTDLDVRIAATRALGDTRDKAAIAMLGEAMEDGDPAMQFRAMESLRLVSGRDFGQDMKAWREFAKNADAAPPPSIAERFKTMWR